MSVIWSTVGLLVLSNIFMTFAWYGHLKNLSDRKWYVAAIISWGIALFEYLLQVPANRIGATELSLPKLKNYSGSHNADGLCAVRIVLYESADKARLPVGGTLPARRGLFHLS